MVVASTENFAKTENSLFFTEGQEIAVLAERKNRRYYKGTSRGKEGWFLASLVKEIKGIKKVGYLKKRGNWRKNWKERWFMLNIGDNSLRYEPHPGSGEVKGEIPLSAINQVSFVCEEDTLAGSSSYSRRLSFVSPPTDSKSSSPASARRRPSPNAHCYLPKLSSKPTTYFQIVCASRTYFLFADSQADAQHWIETINEVIENRLFQRIFNAN